LTIQEICSLFYIDGKFVGCEELTTGNINNTYLITYQRDNENKKYILQRINKNVFKQPEKVMDNIVSVTEYIKEKIKEKNFSAEKFVLKAYKSKQNDKHFVIDNNGEYWRCYRYIDNSETFDTSDDLNIIEKVGQAFGRFQNCLDGFDAKSLNITIPDFHNTIKRYIALENAIKEDACNRVRLVKNEINDLLEMKERACSLQQMLDSGELQLRVTHNDTKCNNVCFDKDTHEALAVLDLDTVMSGAVAHDFGDAIRSAANVTSEDELNNLTVRIDIERFRAFAEGFISATAESLTQKEIETLALGAFTMALELSVRFLDDYITGDKYFEPSYVGHNLVRTRIQLALAEDIHKNMPTLNGIVEEIYRKSVK
jgi:Ser/Thr protein kinase RdoA (MazF antagonist)